MKKVLGLIVLLVLAEAVWAEGSVTVYNADGSPQGNYTTIQTGINACPDGGTVSVAVGTYPEAVYVNKGICGDTDDRCIRA